MKFIFLIYETSKTRDIRIREKRLNVPFDPPIINAETIKIITDKIFFLPVKQVAKEPIITIKLNR